MTGYGAMREFVKQHGTEEKQAGYHAQRPKLAAAPLRVARAVLVYKRIGDQAEDQDPAQVQKDGNAEHLGRF